MEEITSVPCKSCIVSVSTPGGEIDSVYCVFPQESSSSAVVGSMLTISVHLASFLEVCNERKCVYSIWMLSYLTSAPISVSYFAHQIFRFGSSLATCGPMGLFF